MRKTVQPRHDLVIEKDVEITLRDGVRLKADVFRPKASGKFPALINIGAYQKDKLWVPPPDLEEAPNQYMNWETVNPLWWVPRGYAAVRVDTRARSKHKKLRIHAGTHYHPFYAEEAREDQLRFLDHWLKGIDTGIMDEPPVKLLIRTGGGKGYHGISERAPHPPRHPAQRRGRQCAVHPLQCRL